MVLPAFFISSSTSFSMTALAGSSPAKGSSMRMRSGSCSRAAMNWTFCCIPLESSSTFLCVHSLAWCGRLQLSEGTHKKVEELSKGMQQKVQFIAALLHDPDLILMDEPF